MTARCIPASSGSGVALVINCCSLSTSTSLMTPAPEWDAGRAECQCFDQYDAEPFEAGTEHQCIRVAIQGYGLA